MRWKQAAALFIITFVISVVVLAQTSVILSGQPSATGTATIGGIGTAVVLTAISVAPPNPAIPYNAAQSFTALGTYSNGSSADVTGSPTVWTSSNAGVATNSGQNFQCVARGVVTVSAVQAGVTGTTTLTCQSPTFTPQGTVNVPQGFSSVTIVQFTGSNGSSPYTFSSGDLPGWLTLSNSGCAGTQINCSLVGTPSVAGVYNFHILATDNIGNTSQGPGCTVAGCAVAVNVTATSAEDNIYCTAGEVVTGLSMDGPANPLANCNNTAIANTSLGGSPTIINVCPAGQLSNGVAVAGCAANVTPAVCNVTSSVIYCNAIQAAVNYAYNTLSSPCGADIQLWPRIDDDDSTLAHRTSAQNVYTEPRVTSPGNINCGPDYGQVWWTIRTRKYASLPPTGNRVSPSWVNQPSIVGRPNYSQTTDFSIPQGIYMPMWRGTQDTSAFCVALSSQMASATVGQILNGLRVTGIMFACPHGRDSSLDAYGNHVCQAIPGGGYTCSPGSTNSVVSLGCTIVQGNLCNITSPSQGKPATLPHNTGSQHVILDRVIVSGCDDITMLTCYDIQADLVGLQNGQHMSLIDSYLIHGFCMFAVGPCVESHGLHGGNPQGSLSDTAVKVVNNYIESSSVNVFFGGGTTTAGLYPTDVEVRRNHFWKPLTWKADDQSFVGKVQDVFVSHGGAGYSGATTCSIDPPKSGTTATCTAVVVGGAIADVLITNKGSGYTVRDKRNGTTYPALPAVYFTDGGTTYTSCANQLAGFVTTNGTDVAWVHDNKFIAGIVGTLITINNVNYTVASFNSNINLTLTTSAGVQTNVAYASNFPVRGDCVHTMTGIGNVKNLGEFKNGIRILWEGNIAEQVWQGQSDQDASCFLITPKNPNNLAPTASVQDLAYRYNFCRNTVNGMQAAEAAATQGGTLAQALTRISAHDDIFDAMIGPYWTAGTAPVGSGGGTCLFLSNVNLITYVTSKIRINHFTCIHTIPTGYTLTGGSTLAMFQNLTTTSLALMPSVTFQNTIAGGGVKNVSSRTQGAANCLNNGCTDQVPAHGPSEVSLRQTFVSDFLLPVAGGVYTTNQVVQLKITEGGTCTVLPTTVTLSPPGGGGTTATAAFNTGSVGVAHQAITKLWVGRQSAGGSVGSGYTSAPTVTFNGTCSVPPTATAYIAGATNPSNSSACFDHNVMPLTAWNGVIAMNPYPTTQIDPLNNACDSTSGGHNNTNAAGTPVTVNTWQDVKFVNFPLDANLAEKPTGDLHLQASSPFHLGANDGLDIGANVDLVLGKSDGSQPSQYTGCTINAGVTICPQ